MNRFVDPDASFTIEEEVRTGSVYKAVQKDEAFYIKYEPDRSFREIQRLHSEEENQAYLVERLDEWLGDLFEESDRQLHTEIQSEIAAYTVKDHLGVDQPRVQYDDENRRLFIEATGDVDRLSDSDSIDAGSYADAAASKLVVGDGDMEGNIVADEEGTCYAIDHGSSGLVLKEMDFWMIPDSFYDFFTGYWGFYEEIRGDAVYLSRRYDPGIDVQDIDEQVARMVEDVDPDAVYERLDGIEALDGFQRKDNYAETIAFLQDHLS